MAIYVNKTNYQKFNIYNNNIKNYKLSVHNNNCKQISNCNCIEVKKLTKIKYLGSICDNKLNYINTILNYLSKDIF